MKIQQIFHIFKVEVVPFNDEHLDIRAKKRKVDMKKKYKEY